MERELECALICPVCGEPLHAEGRVLCCPHRHSYDVAREGYVDLLPPGHGRSRITGDTREMARARQQFLERGHYAPLAAALSNATLAAVRESGRHGGATLLEAGCGTGWFLARVAAALQAATGDVRACGFDVSREALRVAARSCRAARFFVNDVRHRICLADASVDLLLLVLAPRNPAEFARVLRPGATLLAAVPGPGHLAELRAALPLLDVPGGKVAALSARLGDRFTLVERTNVTERRQLAADDVAWVLRMTPSRRHLTDADIARGEALAPLAVTTEFTVLRYLRRAQAPA